MVKKAWFDVEWNGPEVEVDTNGKVTSKGREAKREYTPPFSSGNDRYPVLQFGRTFVSDIKPVMSLTDIDADARFQLKEDASTSSSSTTSCQKLQRTSERYAKVTKWAHTKAQSSTV